ncbi:hypothetical protein LTR47_009071 [Exophiala xenobiotica]|nr:hypothetical protein LTR92_005220 [Exophiala xenobiotica]KAK5209673.1 hypothetical protein LTR41_004305 [Exophiala xenobiotica]KAK5225543.1 hypothetical protein LTR72_003446 [Exophiala xenobiotica]KAK5226393.1 hypothetical protein LTR47_009071 [Exophiala xenobiotica]KAK5253957.1 hypothetical protein LTS06_001763 [Exophiala xenobiotica]
MPKLRKLPRNTFSGCFTCRARGVKCDEARPACRRCTTADLSCEGYGIRLIWESDRQEKQSLGSKRIIRSQRRSINRTPDSSCPLMSQKEIDLALETLDSTKIGHGLRMGPFSVFEAHISCCETAEAGNTNGPVYCSVSDESSGSFTWDLTWDPSSDSSGRDPSDLEIQDTFGDWSTDDNKGSEGISRTSRYMRGRASLHPEQLAPSPDAEDTPQMLPLYTKPSPCLTPFPGLVSKEENFLLHGWVNYVSDLMIPVECFDNPFKTIFIPLALSAMGLQGRSAGHAALLHAIYALTASNRAGLKNTPNDIGYSTIAVKHEQLSLRFLRISLRENSDSQRDAVLATAIAIVSNSVVAGQFSNWRHSMHGVQNWLLSIDRQTWETSKTSSILYQIFLGLETIAASAGARGGLSKVDRMRIGKGFSYNNIFGLSEGCLSENYRLDSLYGISRPVLESIAQINSFGSRGTAPSESELEALKAKILLNDPRSLPAMSTDSISEELIRHHAYVFHYACRIYYERFLRSSSHNDIVHLINKGAEHLEAIARIDQRMNVTGLMWPAFIIAVEAEDENTRRYSPPHEAVKLGGKVQDGGTFAPHPADVALAESWAITPARHGVPYVAHTPDYLLSLGTGSTTLDTEDRAANVRPGRNRQDQSVERVSRAGLGQTYGFLQSQLCGHSLWRKFLVANPALVNRALCFRFDVDLGPRVSRLDDVAAVPGMTAAADRAFVQAPELRRFARLVVSKICYLELTGACAHPTGSYTFVGHVRSRWKALERHYDQFRDYIFASRGAVVVQGV